MTRVADLAGANLALWVCRAEGNHHAATEVIDGELRCYRNNSVTAQAPYRPHADWAQGGPIIEKYDIDTRKASDGGYFAEAWIDHADGNSSYGRQFGPTRLIASMRAIVASVFGETVGEVAQ